MKPVTHLWQILFLRCKSARLAALFLCAALAFGPVFLAFTHGFGPLVPLSHQHQWQNEDNAITHAGLAEHGHHATADHDHTTKVILSPFEETLAPKPPLLRVEQAHQLSGIIRDGPRRPPRLI